MSNYYRTFVFALLAIGLVVSIISGTDLCNFGGCTEAHQYRLFGLSFPAFGIAFFLLAGVAFSVANRFPAMELLFSLLIAGAAGAEMNMILLQKNVIRAWCPLCLGIAAVIYLLTAFQLGRYLTVLKEEKMRLKSLYKPLMMCAMALLGFTLTFAGIAKEEAAASMLNYHLGKQDSKLEVYLFSDWLCPVCAEVEGVVETQYPILSQKAKIVFVDKIIHPESVNFVPYHLSFAVHEKQKYMALRKALFALARKNRNPTFEDVSAAIAPLKVTYKQLSFLDVTQQMALSRQLSDQFKVSATPSMVIRNSKTNQIRTLIGNKEITADKIAKALRELE